MDTQKVYIKKTDGSVSIMTLILDCQREKTLQEFAEHEIEKQKKVNPACEGCAYEFVAEKDIPVFKFRESLKVVDGKVVVDEAKEIELEEKQNMAKLIKTKEAEILERMAKDELNIP